MIAEVNGVSLFYEKRGEGRPIVMVHGNGEDHTIFDKAAVSLSARYAVYCLDSRCHGRSTDTPELHYADMAADVVAFLEALDLRDAVFYGFSDGGIIGLMAAPQTERITTLIVSGANTSPKAVKGWLRALIAVLRVVTRDKKIKLMLNEPQITDAELSSIRARTLVLAGSADLIPEWETRHIAAAIPGAEMKILPGEGHGSYIVHSLKIAELIRAFLRGKEQR
ncbi:MAG: alpha/beta fold hydrolase [Oscillospiraceae bacterium]|nr:alpha/beta fold hydrolase [Oscillospiraceae bacterium]